MNFYFVETYQPKWGCNLQCVEIDATKAAIRYTQRELVDKEVEAMEDREGGLGILVDVQSQSSDESDEYR